MRTSMTASEKRRLAQLNIDPATLATFDGTNPFNLGQRVFKYQPNDLRFEELKRETQRTAAFKQTLQYLQSQLGGAVPYAFRTTDGAIRSLDAGCLGFLFHRDPPQITFEQDDAGYITSVRLVGPAVADALAGAPYTVEGLVIAGRKAAFRRLIEAARASELVTYGQMANHLQIALSNARISHHHMGHVVGSLMDRILVADLEAPLINLELVLSDEREPGLGADSYLRRRFNVRGALSDERRHDLVEQGLAEVRAFDGWPDLYEQIIGEPLNPGAVADEIDLDGQGDNPRYSGLAESPEHHALKKHVHENPGCLGLRLNAPVGSIESRLLSGDEMDVELVDGDRRIGIEVKSIRSGDLDLRRGIYQCVKYRALMVAEAQGASRKRRCEVILVTERPLPKNLRALATCLDIPHKVVRINRR